MYIFAGDSWALKGFTNDNWNNGRESLVSGDMRLADYWSIPYELALEHGRGNLSILDKILKLDLLPTTPVIWVYTEPGRDFGRITGQSEFDWIVSEEIFTIRKQLDQTILETIKQKLPNPVALIGGLSDINVDIATQLGYKILCPSWQKWIADKLDSRWFKQVWGVGDVGWRMHSNNVTPSKAAAFAWDEQIKEWCWWEDQGYFCHEHPSPRANKEFAEYLKPQVEQWLKQYEK